jgi:3-methylcrotonyl-CoA carboxylase alpha subunit
VALTLPLAAAPFAALAAASLTLLHAGQDAAAGPGRRPDEHSPWNRRDGWRLMGEPEYELLWLDAGLERHLTLRFGRAGVAMTLDASTAAVKLISRSDTELRLELDTERVQASMRRHGAEFDVAIAGQSWQLHHLDPLARRAGAEAGSATLVAPVHGRVLDVLVAAGGQVTRGQLLMRLECMKLEYRVVAPADGTVEALHYAAGDVVEDGAQLLTFTRSVA